MPLWQHLLFWVPLTACYVGLCWLITRQPSHRVTNAIKHEKRGSQ